jgi:hypothetical protein
MRGENSKEILRKGGGLLEKILGKGFWEKDFKRR